MSNGVMPIVRLQLEGFREAIAVALSQRHFEIDTYVQDAIDKALDPAAIKQLIDREATAAVETCVKQAIESYFR